MKHIPLAGNKLHISIIIPTYNASGTIRTLVEQLESALQAYHITLLLIDDYSRDNTVEIIGALAKENSTIQHHFSPVNKGQQSSLLTGLKLLKSPCDYVVTMDDDLQNPASVVKHLLEEIQQGHDLVYAIPFSHRANGDNNPSPLRRLGGYLRNALFDSFINKPPGIKVSAFRVMTFDLALQLAQSNKKYFYLSAEAFQHQVKTGNIFYPYTPRAVGTTSYNLRRLIVVYMRLLLTYKVKLFK